MLKSLSKPMQYAVIGALAIVAYLLASPVLFPESAPHKVAKPTSKKSSKKGVILYTDADYKAQFEPVAAAAKNSFSPLIKTTGKGGGSALAPIQNALPPEFAGGEQNWVYTGTAEVDGILQALLENRTTGDNVFLKVGDTWKGISVEEITDDSLVLLSADTGTERTLRLPTEDTPVSSGPAGFSPAAPAIRGPIGPMSLQPDLTAQDPNAGNMPAFGGMPNGGGLSPADMTNSGNGNSGRNGSRRGRRNRNNGGGN